MSRFDFPVDGFDGAFALVTPSGFVAATDPSSTSRATVGAISGVRSVAVAAAVDSTLSLGIDQRVRAALFRKPIRYSYFSGTGTARQVPNIMLRQARPVVYRLKRFQCRLKSSGNNRSEYGRDAEQRRASQEIWI